MPSRFDVRPFWEQWEQRYQILLTALGYSIKSYDDKGLWVNQLGVSTDPLCPYSWPLDHLCFDDSSGRPLQGYTTIRVGRENTRTELTKFLFRDIVTANSQPLLFLAESVFIIASPSFPLLLLTQCFG